MVKKDGANSKSMRSGNKASILLRLFEVGAMSRKALAKSLGLTSAAITFLVRELIEEGKVIENGKKQENASGRKEVLLDIAYDALTAYGINAERDKVHFSVTTPREVIAEVIRPATELINAFDKATYIADIISTLPTNGTAPLGLGVSVSGFLNFDGTVADTGGLFDRGYDINKSLSRITKLKVFTMNNVRAQARALINGNNRDFIYIKHGPGLGAAIICNGYLLTGADNKAGELGHTYYMEDEKNLEELLAENNLIADYTADAGFSGSIKDLYALFKKDIKATEFLSRRLNALSSSIVNAIALFNPQAVLASGGLFDNDSIYSTVTEAVTARCKVRFERIESAIRIKSIAGAGLVFDNILFR